MYKIFCDKRETNNKLIGFISSLYRIHMLLIFARLVWTRNDAIAVSRSGMTCFKKLSKTLSMIFRGNSKIPSDTQRQGPSFKFGQSPHFETELNKIRNNFDLRRGGEPTFLERISNFFQPISRIMSHPWKWSDLSGHYVIRQLFA